MRSVDVLATTQGVGCHVLTQVSWWIHPEAKWEVLVMDDQRVLVMDVGYWCRLYHDSWIWLIMLYYVLHRG